MECPYFDAQGRCSCRQNSDQHQLSTMDLEDYCRRSRYVLCPTFNEAESVDLAGLLEDDEAR